jgi:uncharacterized protein YuzE
MRVSYDVKIDAAYIQLDGDLSHGGVARTVPVDPREIDGMINLDFDAAGRLVGIEVLEASRFLAPGLLRPGRE